MRNWLEEKSHFGTHLPRSVGVSAIIFSCSDKDNFDTWIKALDHLKHIVTLISSFWRLWSLHSLPFFEFVWHIFLQYDKFLTSTPSSLGSIRGFKWQENVVGGLGNHWMTRCFLKHIYFLLVFCLLLLLRYKQFWIAIIRWFLFKNFFLFPILGIFGKVEIKLLN